MGRDWLAILEGELAERALEVVRDIAAVLVTGDGTNGTADPVDSTLFWAYAQGLLDDAASETSAAFAADRLADRLERGVPGLGLHGGLSGAGWVVQHITDSDDDTNEESLAVIDREILSALAVDRWEWDYDLVAGLVGIGVYLVERVRSSHSPAAVDALGRVVHHLGAGAERTADGITWHTRPDLLPAWQRERAPTGYYNLGLAHGVPGVVGLLGLVIESGQGSPLVEELHAGAARWLLARRLPTGRGARFAATFVPGQPDEPTRSAWCYGDPGVAAALWGSARRIRDAGLEATAIELAAGCLDRPLAEAGIADACVCHGSIGLAHLYNRYWQASGDPRFRQAAVDWIRRALADRRPGEAVAGFPAFDGMGGNWSAEGGFLVGAAGVGLALASALGLDPGWDRLLLCDIPPAE